MSANYEAASPTFTKVSGYSNNGLSYTLTAATDLIVGGTTYAFKTRAINEKGNSEFSEELIIAVAAPIAKPDAPVRNLALSVRDTISN